MRNEKNEEWGKWEMRKMRNEENEKWEKWEMRLSRNEKPLETRKL